MTTTLQRPGDAVTVADLPRSATVLLVGLCALPLVLRWIGLDLGSPHPPDDFAVVTGVDALHRALAGAFVHTMLEWSAFLVAFFTVVVAFTHYRVVGDPATPIIGTALFCAGALDLFHVLAADRLIAAVAEPERLIPFTWALSRLWNALILIVGPVLLLWRPRGLGTGRHKTSFVLVTCAAFGVFAHGLVLACARSTQLPPTLVPDAWIRRPWDVVPLVLFGVAAWVLKRFHGANPSVFTAALLWSCVPQIATQLWMAFGSASLFDHGFNVAHGMKVLAYGVPFLGLMLDYVQSQKLARRSREELEARVRDRTAELRRAEAEAAAANRAKSDFLARMSHELRTPLNSILGYAQIFRSDPSLDARKRKGLDTIQASGEHLLDLVNDVLDLAKIEARKLDVVPRPFRLPQLLDQIADSEGLRARQRGLEWRFTASADLPDEVTADDRRLRQILLNLLGNALRYTETGHVALEVEPDPDAGPDMIRFTVRDTGIGISEADLETIFDPFQQSRAASLLGEGSGLGLAITLQLVELMAGTIDVTSRVGVGSTFTVRLPLPCCLDADPLDLAESAADWMGDLPRRREASPSAAPATSDSELGPWPPEAQLEALLEAARRGAVRELVGLLEPLEAHGGYGACVTRLRRYVDAFDMQAVREILTSRLETPHGERPGD
ncbi:MAG: ATP-binding protein [Acidobacteriota bacterium]